MGYMMGTTCPPGTHRCATGELIEGSRRALQEGGGDVSVVCGNCFGESAGPCRNDANGVCYDYNEGTQDCPAGTSACVPCQDCAGDTAGPCKHLNDDTCLGYLFGTTCPAGSYQCATGEDGVGVIDEGGEPDTELDPIENPNSCASCLAGTSGPCVHDNDLSCHDYMEGTTSCPAGTHACSVCSGCIGGTSGTCQHNNDGTCFPYMAGTTCPPGTSRCGTAEVSLEDEPAADRRLEGFGSGMAGPVIPDVACGDCFGESAGPCKNTADNVCFDYLIPEDGTCPPGTTACVPCLECTGDTSGPCRHNNDGTCQGYTWGTTCAAGTTQCATGEAGVGGEGEGEIDEGAEEPAGNQCANCWGDTAGPCKHINDGSCQGYTEGTTTCPVGTQACVLCSECAGGTSGPCSHNNDGTCLDYIEGTTCPAGSTRCATGEITGLADSRRLQEGFGSGMEGGELSITCSDCTGVSSGPCKHDNDGSCLGYIPGTTTCPPGTTVCSPCNECHEGTSGPCQHMAADNDICFGYAFDTTCPAGTMQCATGELGGGSEGGGVSFPPAVEPACGECAGGTTGPCQHNNDNTCLAYIPDSDPPACPAGTTACVACAGCVGGTSGSCRHLNDGTCMGYGSDGNCPAGTAQCSEAVEVSILSSHAENCGPCFGESSGPCRHEDNDVCHEFYTGTEICPSGTKTCILCSGCAEGAGPCKHDNDDTCEPFESGSQCAAGTTHCATGESGGQESSAGVGGLCTTCWPGTSGPCQSANTVCYDYFPGTTTCHAGTCACADEGCGAEAEPVVVLDISIRGGDDIDEETAKEAIADNAGDGVDADDVVIDTITETTTSDRSRRRLDVTTTNVGATVVVTRDSGASATDVAANLDSAISSGAFAESLEARGVQTEGVAANRPITAASSEFRISSQENNNNTPSGPAPAGGLSGIALGLIITGSTILAVAVIYGVFGGSRRPSGAQSVQSVGSLKKVTPTPGLGSPAGTPRTSND